MKSPGSLLPDAMNAESFDPKVAVHGADREPSLGVRGGVFVAQEAHTVAPVFDAGSVCDHRDGLRACWPSAGTSALERSCSGQQWASDWIADVTAKSSGRVRVAAEADVIGEQVVVVCERAAAWLGERRGSVLVTRHPECVHVADAIVRSAGGNRSRVECDCDRSAELRLEPQRGAGWNIDVQHAIDSAYRAGLFQFDRPLLQPIRKSSRAISVPSGGK